MRGINFYLLQTLQNHKAAQFLRAGYLASPGRNSAEGTSVYQGKRSSNPRQKILTSSLGVIQGVSRFQIASKRSRWSWQGLDDVSSWENINPDSSLFPELQNHLLLVVNCIRCVIRVYPLCIFAFCLFGLQKNPNEPKCGMQAWCGSWALIGILSSTAR